MSSPAQQTIRAADGVELAYWLQRAPADRDRVLVLLHGAASNHTRWSEFTEKTRLKDSWSVLAPDLRGNGESMVRGGQTISHWTRDLAEQLDAVGSCQAVLVGHSLGAQIAIHMTHRYPDRIRGLVLLDPVFPEGLQGKLRWVWRLRWLVRALRALVRALNACGLRRRSIPNRDIRKLDEDTRARLASSESFEAIAREYTSLRPILGSLPTANYLGQMIATVSPLPPLSTIRVPVAVLLSGGTTLADTRVNLEIVGGFANGEVITLDANHWPLTEAPDETREVIENWIERTFGALAPSTSPSPAADPAKQPESES